MKESFIYLQTQTTVLSKTKLDTPLAPQAKADGIASFSGERLPGGLELQAAASLLSPRARTRLTHHCLGRTKVYPRPHPRPPQWGESVLTYPLQHTQVGTYPQTFAHSACCRCHEASNIAFTKMCNALQCIIADKEGGWGALHGFR